MSAMDPLADQDKLRKVLSGQSMELCNFLQNVVAITYIFGLQQPTFLLCNFLHLYSATNNERCGYYGELLVLKAQELGLNTCWAALTHGRSKAVIGADEKEVIVIALGYGKTQGIEHKSKKLSDVSNISADAPVWFKRGVKAAILAPTAVNQQKFRFERKGNTVTAKAGRIGPCLKIDLGIVKCHFEIGAGKENFIWG